MDDIDDDDLAALIKALRAEVRVLAGCVAALEQRGDLAAPSLAAGGDSKAATANEPVPTPAAPSPAPAAQPEASEEDMLVIAAAVAAFVGVRARIRQVRLIQSSAWAQVGRATVHASHRVH